MNRYKVTRDDVSQDIEAANDRAACRTFLDRYPGLDPNVEFIDELPAPVKHRYRVTWGEESREVIAVHEDDAWSQFCGSNTDAECYRHPNLHSRLVEDLGPAEEVSEKVIEPTEPLDSPVASMSADEAIDQITRMRSPERLQEIIVADKRSTVQTAAKKRLEEIGG